MPRGAGGIRREQRSVKKAAFQGSDTGRRRPERVSFLTMEPRTPAGEPKPTLLIVDDDQALCAMLIEYLTLEGFAVGRGHRTLGLEQLARAPVDLVILDVMLPELSGLKCCGASAP